MIPSSGLETYNKRVFVNDLKQTSMLMISVPIVAYLDYWKNVFDLNETFTTAIHERSAACGYTDYINKYLTFPPPGPFPTPTNSSDDCDIFDDVFAAALEVNPCFNIYHILDTCPHLFNPLGIVNSGDYFPVFLPFSRVDLS